MKSPPTNSIRSSEIHEIAEAMRAREGLYNLLARLFLSELDKEYITILVQLWTSFKCTSEKGENDFEKGAKMIQQVLDSWQSEKDSDDALSTLRKDFAHLFLVKNDGGVHPYESVYLSPDRLLMQEPYDNVREFYKNAGIVRNDRSQEIEDHVAVECEFMAMLCGFSQAAAMNNDIEEVTHWIDVQRSFLVEHMYRWVPLLCKDMLNRTRSVFYQGVAIMMKGFMETEIDEMNRMNGCACE